MPCDVQLLDGIGYFEKLQGSNREALAEALDQFNVAAGRTIYRQGEPGEAIYVVRQGAVELSVKDVTGEKIVLHVAEGGQLFGALAMVEGEPRHATATALDDSSVLMLDRGDMLLLFGHHPDTALAMMAALGEVTRKASFLLQTGVARNVNEEMEEQEALSPMVRFADFLAWLSGTMGFLIFHVIEYIIWIAFSIYQGPEGKFDPFPMWLLTLTSSLETVLLSTIVLLSQNRQVAKSKVRNDVEYQVNINAELQVAHLHHKFELIHEIMLQHFYKVEKALILPIEGRAAILADATEAKKLTSAT